jgi:hypothetical protein
MTIAAADHELSLALSLLAAGLPARQPVSRKQLAFIARALEGRDFLSRVFDN